MNPLRYSARREKEKLKTNNFMGSYQNKENDENKNIQISGDLMKDLQDFEEDDLLE